MITAQMVKTLQKIRNLEEGDGAAVTTDINVYKHRTSLYRCLERLEKINAVQEHEAPSTAKVQNTYTTTDFGKKLLKNLQDATQKKQWKT